MSQTIGQIGEKPFIQSSLLRWSRRQKKKLRVPPGDDAVVLSHPPYPVLSIDGLSDGVHFQSSWIKKLRRSYGISLGHALGWKAVSSALSDLASMGETKNRWAMIFLGAPSNTPVSFLRDLARGTRDVATAHRVTLAGGDTVKSRTLTLAVAVGAELVSKRVLTRTGSRPGDYLCVAGSLGGAAIGLDVIKGQHSYLSKKDRRTFAKQFFYHDPLFSVGAQLAKEKGVHGVLDLSDSLHESIGILLSSAKLGVDVNVDSIPTSKPFLSVRNKTKALLSSGEDYGLLFSLAPTAVGRLRRRMRFSILGRLSGQRKGIRYFSKGKRLKSVKPFAHF